MILVSDNVEAYLLDIDGSELGHFDKWVLDTDLDDSPMSSYGFSLKRKDLPEGSSFGLYSQGFSVADPRFPLFPEQTPGCAEYDTRDEVRVYWCTGSRDELRIIQANAESDRLLQLSDTVGDGEWIGVRLSRRADWVAAARNVSDLGRIDYLISVSDPRRADRLADLVGVDEPTCLVAIGWSPKDALILQHGGMKGCTANLPTRVLTMDPNSRAPHVLWEHEFKGPTVTAAYFAEDIVR